jgi:hypothetical protein
MLDERSRRERDMAELQIADKPCANPSIGVVSLVPVHAVFY